MFRRTEAITIDIGNTCSSWSGIITKDEPFDPRDSAPTETHRERMRTRSAFFSTPATEMKERRM